MREEPFGPFREVKQPNAVEIEGEVAWIILTGNQGQEVARTCIDTEDVERVALFRWRKTHTKGRPEDLYVISHKVGGLHRYLLGAPDTLEVDHIDGNGLNNRRENLRLVTRAQNNQNVAVKGREQLRGVYLAKNNKWTAMVTHDRKQFHLGTFDTEEEAKEAAREGRAQHLPFANENRH